MALLLQVITSVALFLISLTMLLRCHEYDEKGGKAFLRKMGLLGSGLAPVGLGLAVWFGWNFEVYFCLFTVSLFLVFFTTPNGVPWHKWVWFGLQKVEEELEDGFVRKH